jgi:hypothetical protein
VDLGCTGPAAKVKVAESDTAAAQGFEHREGEGGIAGGCGNDADDDGDGLVDCDDPDCEGAPDCEEPPPADTGVEQWDPLELDYKFVSAGFGHVCGMDKLSHVHCWGDNAHGQTQEVPGEYAGMSTGGYHTCASATDGPAVCWGRGYDDGSIVVPDKSFWDVSSGGTCMRHDLHRRDRMLGH